MVGIIARQDATLKFEMWVKKLSKTEVVSLNPIIIIDDK